jgi:hypothetical protein
LQQLLDAPEVGGLPREGGAVDGRQGGELAGVVLAEVAEEVAVGGQLPERADEFDGDDLAVGRGRAGAAPAQAGQVGGFQLVVGEAEYVEQEVLWGRGWSSGRSTG